MNAGLTFTDSVICYKELIEKEDTARRVGKQRLKEKDVKAMWRPVEPFEATGASESKTELPPSIPVSAIRNPPLYRDTVGNEGLSGGTPLRFGGRWDIVSEKVEPWVDPDKPQKVVKKGPHDCYCEIGFAAWSMAGKARTVNHGLRGTFEREFWTNTPGELALVWDFSGAEKRKALAQSKAAAANAEAMAKLDAQVAGAPSAAPGRS